jgi:restriction system protein
MAILRYSDYFNFVLETLRDEGPMHRNDLRDRIAEKVQLTDEERRRTNAKGTNIFGSRIHWSGAILVLAGLLERPSRGQIGITQLGRELLQKHPGGITE